MRRVMILTVGICLWLTSVAGKADQAAEATADQVVGMEKQWWEAWKNNDVSWYRNNLKSDMVFVNDSGRQTKTNLVESATNARCDVRSFSLGDFQTMTLAEGVVLLSYKAEVDATCEGQKAPAHVYGTSIYVSEDSRWLIAFAQETVVPE